MAGGAFKYRPFTFDRSFDEAEIERARQAAAREQEEREEAERQAELERNPPPPTFTEEELLAAKSTAFQEGQIQGETQTLAGIDAQTLSALQTITGQLAVLHDRQSLANESNSAQLAKITGDIIERLLPQFVKIHGTDEIIALVRECLEPLEDSGRVIIKVPEENQEILADKLNQAAQESGFEGKLVIKGDAALGPSDVKIDWGQGGTERKLQETWGAIKDAIDHCLAHTVAQATAADQSDGMAGNDLAEETPAGPDSPPAPGDMDNSPAAMPTEPEPEPAPATESATVMDADSEPANGMAPGGQNEETEPEMAADAGPDVKVEE